MPKQTFFNLPEEKKETILTAALKEFSQKNIHEASVANIVREAEIARGSFYKYFEDINDLYFYLFRLIAEDAHISVIDSIKKKDGDLFKGLELYLKTIVKQLEDPTMHAYFKVMTLNLDYQTEQKMAQQSVTDDSDKLDSQDFIPNIATDNLKVTSKAELDSFFKVLVPVVHECLSDFFSNGWTKEELFAEYYTRIEWLKYGIIKEKDEE